MQKLLFHLILGAFCLSDIIAAPALGQSEDTKIILLDGSTRTGVIERIDESGRAWIKGHSDPILFSEIETILFPAAEIAPRSNEVTVQLVNGSCLRVTNPQIELERFTFDSSLGLTELPFQFVSAIIWKPSSNLETLIGQPSTSDDRVIVETNDGERVVTGVVEGMDLQQLQIQYQNESRKISLSRITAIIMAAIGGKPAEGAQATILLREGSRVVGIIRAIDQGNFTVAMGDSHSVQFGANPFHFNSLGPSELPI
jgi:small nuclear ribonucleoprotein (snRNP)-like protein